MMSPFRNMVALGLCFGTLAPALPAEAYFSSSTATNPLTLSQRVAETRAQCFGERYAFPRITYDTPQGIWVDIYRTNAISRATMLIYEPLTHGLGGVIQSGIDLMIGDGQAIRGLGALKAMGFEADRFARRHGMNRLEAVCLASCVVNHMIEGTEDIPHMLSLDLALGDGVGDCKIYSEAMDVVARQMGITLWLATSWKHAFNRVSYGGQSYYFDATRWDGMKCNFTPTSFYD